MCVCVCTSHPENFTGCGSEVVNTDRSVTCCYSALVLSAAIFIIYQELTDVHVMSLATVATVCREREMSKLHQHEPVLLVPLGSL